VAVVPSSEAVMRHCSDSSERVPTRGGTDSQERVPASIRVSQPSRTAVTASDHRAADGASTRQASH